VRVMLQPLLIASALAATHPALASPSPAAAVAAPAPLANPQIDYDGYRALIEEVQPYRRARLIDWDAFTLAAAEPHVLILDARSAEQFAAGHIKGAVNVPLPEFSDERLAEVIGRTDRPILIYCNNNFRNDRPPVMLKSGRLALNLSTFTHLYGYCYRNLRELKDVMDFNDPRVRWVTG
jgi:phage shock protein E